MSSSTAVNMAAQRAMCVLWLVVVLHFSASEDSCENLNSYFMREKPFISSQAQHRYVDPHKGNDSDNCLNSTTRPPPPCRTLQFALHGNSTQSIADLVVHLAPGTLVMTGGVSIINSQRIALVGSGANSTFLNCGLVDKLCEYMNLQIRNSSYVWVSGVTFTRCGPITSIVYIAESDHIFIEDCEFRDITSPPVLVYNTPTVLINNTEFINNWPQYLLPNVTRNICYFSGGQDVFFLDNRTTSGGVSLYIDRQQLKFLVSNCMFRNLSARPDMDISLPRNSERYGHGGAMNVRMLNINKSSVCIEDSSFEDNFAEAHAGALAITFADSATQNLAQVQNCLFMNNSCTDDKCSAGGLAIDFFAETTLNNVCVLGTNFTGNSAMRGSGGAMSMTATDQAVSQGEINSIALENCRFEENTALYDGTAVGGFSLTHTNQPGLPVTISNCVFVNNSGSTGDTGAITVYRILLTFVEKSLFVSNKGGGVTLQESRMDVNGYVEFVRNTAVFGAGIAMTGRSLLLLYDGAYLRLCNNSAMEQGGGIYVETASSDFVLNVLNRGCFLQYLSLSVDVAPDQWNATVEFTGNSAGLAGAAVYANDMSRCRWLGPNGTNLTENYYVIFEPPNSYLHSPFTMSDNKLLNATLSEIKNQALATDASRFSASTEFGHDNDVQRIAYGEKLSFRLSSTDQLMNFRQSVWSLDINGTLDPQPLGALTSNSSAYIFKVPQKNELEDKLNLSNDTTNITATFMLVRSQAQQATVPLVVGECHPGYGSDGDVCVCLDGNLSEIVRCDSFNRYFYVKDGLWVGVEGHNSLFFSTALPGFLDCTRAGSLPGCLFKFDEPNAQCASGRTGTLCGDCKDEYGVTFDLRFCKENCGAGGIVLFIVVCVAILILALAILYFDLPIPNEMKSVIFFAQVIGVIYRNTSYLLDQPGPAYQLFDFLINVLGFAMPFPVCLWEGLPVIAVAFLGFIPTIIATMTAVFYVFGAQRFPFLSKRTYYKFYGFYFLWLFVYKYLVDLSFVFVSCTALNDDIVFIYEGSQKCFQFPFVLVVVFGIVLLVGLGVILPLYVLYIIYQPQKAIQVSNVLTEGLKDRRRYRWYGVWDIWRRLPFVAANLFISVTRRSTVLFIHCILIMACLAITCIVKPYKKTHINVIEICVLLCLFGAAVAVLDENDIYVGITTSIIITTIPFAFGFFFTTYKMIRFIWHKSDKKWHQNIWIRENVRTQVNRLPYYQHLHNIWVFIQDCHTKKEDATTVELQEEWFSAEQDVGSHGTESGMLLREPLLEERTEHSQ